jgi:hypothetical protein
MENEWKVSTQYCGGEKIYQVYRIRDENEVDHTGNREYVPGIFETSEAAHEKAKELNGYAAEDLPALARDFGELLKRTVEFETLEGCRYEKEGLQAYVIATFTDREPLRIHATGTTGTAMLKGILADLQFEKWKEREGHR